MGPRGNGTRRGCGCMSKQPTSVALALELAVHAAVATVDDPEYPGVSIVDLGLLESIEVDDEQGAVRIGLIPTFSGCPALQIIKDDVAAAAAEVAGVDRVEVEWLTTPVWSVSRISAETRKVLASEFTVAVRIGRDAPPCPRCGGPTHEQSMFGPSKCRSINRCEACSEAVEVMRGFDS